MCLTPFQHDDAGSLSDRLTPKGDTNAPISIRAELSGTILITGGLGFLGSVVLESLLRNCPQVLLVPPCIRLLSPFLLLHPNFLRSLKLLDVVEHVSLDVLRCADASVCAPSVCFQVDKVHLLVRGKKTQTAQQRVEKMLCAGLFWMLHKQVAAGGPSPFQKVVAVEGDLCNPGLGLSEADTQQLLDEVDHVIHCAASIELDADIQYTLR